MRLRPEGSSGRLSRPRPELGPKVASRSNDRMPRTYVPGLWADQAMPSDEIFPFSRSVMCILYPREKNTLLDNPAACRGHKTDGVSPVVDIT